MSVAVDVPLRQARSLTPAAVPLPGRLVEGQLGLNVPDAKAWVGDAAASPVPLSSVRPFLSTSQYEEGDYVVHSGVLYLCVLQHLPDVWNPANFRPVGPWVGTSPPLNPIDGQLWWDSEGGNLYAYYDDGDSQQWVPAFSYAAGGSGVVSDGVYIGTTPPANPVHGQMWWDASGGNLYIYYDDGDSLQWVPAFSYALPGDGATAYVGSVAPGNPVEGQLWFDTVSGEMYIWYIDVDSEQWVPAFNGAMAGTIPVGAAPPTDPKQGQQWYDLNSGAMYVWVFDGDSYQWVGVTPIG